ncbi:MAG: UDP-N-acetylmuramate dehydrogenase [Pseudomonadales bacterium]|nr:UDP-N-acetylmuramate dehydrogenase [Pseudomonadales bacterium]
MAIAQSKSLQAYNSFGVQASAAFFTSIANRNDLEEALSYAQQENLPIQVLGSGSNVLLIRDFPGLVVHIGNQGVEWLESASAEFERVRVAAGENWHNFVSTCLNKNLYGLENLALIPGTVGAAPIQNIGAYGAEIANYFVELTAYDREENRWLSMDKSQCEFAYRDSVFKSGGRGRYIVIDVTLELSKQWEPNLSYQALTERLKDTEPNPQTVFETVCSIRREKLPDPAELGNAGSFFKNPTISQEKYAALSEQLPGLPNFDIEEEGLTKIPAAWLLDKLGWKGRSRGRAKVHNNHALVLVNPGEASGEDILLLAQEMSSSVLEKFGIALEPEVQIL